MTRRSSRPPPPLGVVVPAQDFMVRIGEMERRGPLGALYRAEWIFWLAWVSLGAVAFAAPVGGLIAKFWYLDWTMHAWMSETQTSLVKRLSSIMDVDLLEEKPKPEEPKPPEPEPKKDEEERPPPVAIQETKTQPLPAAAARAAAPAPAIVHNDEVVDLTKDPYAFIAGTSTASPGGLVTPGGTGTSAAPNTARTDGVPTGRGAATAAGGPPAQVQTLAPSKARTARLARGSWSCPFPPEADTAGIDSAAVMIEVNVRVDGTPASARILRDPGNGFGRMAFQCAMREHYSAAWDRDGNAVPGVVRANVTFSR